jgi:dUTP pyrophosphatase
MKKIKVYLDDFAFEPVRAHSTDAGLDIKSPSNFVVAPHGSATINTGVHISIPEGYAGFVKSKSGLNVKHDITAEGVVDAGFSGSVVIKLHNLGDEEYHISPKDKVAQIVILPILTPEIEYVSKEDLEEDAANASDRGNSGFGSTGK